MPRETWLPRLVGFDAHPGFLIAIVAAVGLSFVLWRTPFGFALRVAGSSRQAAAYAGFFPVAPDMGRDVDGRRRWRD